MLAWVLEKVPAELVLQDDKALGGVGRRATGQRNVILVLGKGPNPGEHMLGFLGIIPEKLGLGMRGGSGEGSRY